MKDVSKLKYKLLGKNIAKQRKAKNISQNALAELIYCSREHIGKFETAKRGISLDLLFKICTALNISEQELFDFSEIEE